MPPQLEPLPAVQPKQWRPTRMARASRRARSKSRMGGRLLQVDVPETLYARPRTLAAARFVGDADLFRVEGVDAAAVRLSINGASLAVPRALVPDALLKRKGFRTIVNLRAEDNTQEAAVKAAGMKPVYMPVIIKTAPTETAGEPPDTIARVADPRGPYLAEIRPWVARHGRWSGKDAAVQHELPRRC